MHTQHCPSAWDSQWYTARNGVVSDLICQSLHELSFLLIGVQAVCPISNQLHPLPYNLYLYGWPSLLPIEHIRARHTYKPPPLCVDFTYVVSLSPSHFCYLPRIRESSSAEASKFGHRQFLYFRSLKSYICFYAWWRNDTRVSSLFGRRYVNLFFHGSANNSSRLCCAFS